MNETRADLASRPPLRPIAWIGLGLIAASAIAHASVGYDPLPMWSADPTVVYAPQTTLGPAESIALDMIALAGTALLALSGAVRVHWLACVAAIVGGAWAILNNRGPEGVAIGSAWASAIIGMVAASGAARDPRLRPALLASALGCVFLLVGRGAYQVYIEHPRTLQSFREGKAAFLAAQGWSEGSIMAKSFERRLSQPEASGWFGLSNVFATFCAGLLAACAALALSPRRDGDEREPRAMLWAGVLAAVAGVVLAGGKGGYAAALLGVSIAFIAARLGPSRATKLRRLGPVLGAGIVLAALASVVLRGLVGERIGELSLLFRWFYMQGAARIFAHHPITGVGPAGFKDAYMLFKPPLSPEEVTSPHSVFLDYLATLGIAGIAWIGLVLFAVSRAGTALLATPADADIDADDRRTVVRFSSVVAAMAMLVAVYIERPVTTPEALGVRVAGVIVSGMLASAIAHASMRAMGIAAGAAAITMLAHGQIEVTPVWIGSAPLLFILVGLAFGSGQAERAEATTSRPAWPLTAVALIALALAGRWSLPVWTWQSGLARAANGVGDATELKERLQAVQSGRPLFDGDALPAIAADAAKSTGSTPATNLAELRGAITGLAWTRARSAITELDRASAALRRAGLASGDTDRTINRLWLLLVSIQKSESLPKGIVSEDPIAKAKQIAATLQMTTGTTVAEYAGAATFLRAAAQVLGDRSLLKPAADLFEKASQLDPHGLIYPLEAYQTARLMGDRTLAASWAKRCLELDALTRLDPLRGLTDAQREEMRAISR